MHAEREEQAIENNKTENENTSFLNHEITLEFVQSYLAENEFDLLPTQGKISLPLIKRYVQMLRDGKEPPHIHVDENIIVNGHHRYISGHIHNTRPPINAWTRSPSTPVLSWSVIIVDSVDYGPRLA